MLNLKFGGLFLGDRFLARARFVLFELLCGVSELLGNQVLLSRVIQNLFDVVLSEILDCSRRPRGAFLVFDSSELLGGLVEKVGQQKLCQLIDVLSDERRLERVQWATSLN